MSNLIFKNVCKSFGTTEVIHDISLAVNPGEFLVFVGPSGCGKSTMLRLISGLETVTKGEIWLDDNNITNLHPSKRELAMVFQSYALFPHLTVAQNIGFGLSLTKTPKVEIAERVSQIAKTLQLETLLDRKPRELSGGQKQRVAIGRSIIRNPKIFLFDEPLSNLDAALRVRMRLEIAKIHEQLENITMIYVTHDQVEAMTLADRIVVFNNGRIEQVGTPMKLYNKPDNPFVAGFIGAPSMNFFKVKSVQGDKTNFGRKQLNLSETTIKEGEVTVGIRPEHLQVTNKKADFVAMVEYVEKLGSESLVYCKIAGFTNLVTIRCPEEVHYNKGQEFNLNFDRNHMHLF